MSYVIQSMIMPTGWHYEQPTPKGIEKLQAGSYKDLLKFVEEWRVENGYAVGNVELDVSTYICDKYPLQCGRPARRVLPTPRKGQTFVDSISDWLLTISRRGGFKRVGEEEANGRAQICRGCPQNKVYENGCGPCMANIQKIGTLLRGGRDVGMVGYIHGCKILKQDNKTAVWLDIYGDGMDNNQLPDYCWARKK